MTGSLSNTLFRTAKKKNANIAPWFVPGWYLELLELIKFIYPRSECSLYISNLSRDVAEQELANFLSQFGLLCDIHFPEASSKPKDAPLDINITVPPVEEPVVSVVPSAFDTTSTYAVARFYSAAAARQAVQELSGVVLRGKKMKLSITKKRPLAEHERDYPLGVKKRWSSAVAGIQNIEMEPDDTLGPNQFRVTTRVMARITIDGTEILGIGESTEIGNKEDAISLAKKNALAHARKDAFRKIVIIATPSGKVGFHVTEQLVIPNPEPTEQELISNNPPGEIVAEDTYP